MGGRGGQRWAMVRGQGWAGTAACALPRPAPAPAAACLAARERARVEDRSEWRLGCALALASARPLPLAACRVGGPAALRGGVPSPCSSHMQADLARRGTCAVHHQPNLLTPSPCPAAYLRGWRVKTSPVPIKAPFFAGLKSNNYLPNALNLMDAEAEGFDQVGGGRGWK